MANQFYVEGREYPFVDQRGGMRVLSEKVVGRLPFSQCLVVERSYQELNNEKYTHTFRYVVNEQGHYVGLPNERKWLEEYQIVPELADENLTVCTIGRSKKDGKWYGWSHRAMYGFGIGHVVSDGDCGTESIPVGFEVKTDDDAKRVAIAFANDVS